MDDIPANKESLFDFEWVNDWPPHERFPLNTNKKQVKELVFTDLLHSSNPLIITGYTSLPLIIEFLACVSTPGPVETVRLLFGNEPAPGSVQQFQLPGYRLDQEIADYWLRKGISLTLSTKVILAIELVKQQRVQAHLAQNNRPLHAKIYCGDEAVMLGSSNFSYFGLVKQIEANARFTQQEQPRFDETWKIAEQIWQMGNDYTQQLLELLEKLLHMVTWQEALARACGEVLEGKWANQYLQSWQFGDAAPLWPTQEQGIAQAMWIIEHTGSVLIADATGSGKTQLGVHLIRAVVQRIWGDGRMRRPSFPVLICPPGVKNEWRETGEKCGQPLHPYSDGILSSSASAMRNSMQDALRHAQILAVDEAHRYHNRQSGRTKLLYNNMADHVLLFTATPVNRGPHDLLALIDLLGADNFDKEVLDIFEHMGRRERNDGEGIPIAARQVLQKAIQQFTVRRTKSMLNAQIDRDPQRFCDSRGNPCRYPRQKAILYSCGETEHDRKLAAQIRDLAQNLKGLINLRSPFQLSAMQKWEGLEEEKYLSMRLNGARRLAIHHISKLLRSSRAALIEHIHGTTEACSRFQIPRSGKPNSTGNVLQTLVDCAGKLPDNFLRVPLPDWLTDADQHTCACEQERAIYHEIGVLAMEMSDARERTKCNQLWGLLKEHNIVLAFDSTLITLLDLEKRLNQIKKDMAILATGNDPRGKKLMKETAALGSSVRGKIALCSDALSEGFNFPAASAIVHLDMPSVIRIAEQRVGRIDRMNSPHDRIEVYWPNDKSEFALTTDDLFIERYTFVAEILGSNLQIPESSVVSTQEMIREVETVLEQGGEQEVSWDSISDAFEPVRMLIQGPTRLVRDENIYEQIKGSTVQVVSSVSSVVAKHAWAFFAIAGTEWGAPRWVYLDSPDALPITNLEDISQRLREHLDEKTAMYKFDNIAGKLLNDFLQRLKETERLLLSRKKQRALAEMEYILEKYSKLASPGQIYNEGDRKRNWWRKEVLRRLLTLLRREDEQVTVDESILAEGWLDLIRPTWYAHLARRRRRSRPLQLKDIRQDLLQQPLETDALEGILKLKLFTDPLDTRIVATILGVPLTPDTTAAY